MPCNRAQFVHTLMHLIRASSAGCNVWLMAGDAWIGRRLAVCADGQRECGQHGRIHCCVARCLDGVVWSSGKAFVEMQLDSMMTGRSEKGFSKDLLRIMRKKRGWQPKRFETINEPTYLPRVSGPPDVIRILIGTGIRDENILVMLFAPVHIPPTSCRQATDNGRSYNGVGPFGAFEPLEEGAPDFDRLVGVQSMRNHADSEGVVRLYVYLLAPMIVEN